MSKGEKMNLEGGQIDCPCCLAVYGGQVPVGGNQGGQCEILDSYPYIQLGEQGAWYIGIQTDGCQHCGCAFEIYIGKKGWSVVSCDRGQASGIACEEAEKRDFPKKLGKWGGVENFI